MADTGGLTVAVTGPTGTFGLALMPLLQDDGRVERSPSDADHPVDAAFVLQQGHQSQSECSGGPGHRHGESPGVRHRLTLATLR